MKQALTSSFRRALFGGLAALSMLTVFPVQSGLAQIQIGSISDASAYDVNLLDDASKGLDSALWQNTSAPQATALIGAIKPRANAASLRLANAALLSGGVPPLSADGLERDAYVKAKLGALLDQRKFNEFDSFTNALSLRKNNPAFLEYFAGRALLAGQTQEACAQADSNTEQRKLPYWSKLRAFCHAVRAEIPAAELTADILRRSGHKDAGFFSLLGYLTGSAVKAPNISSLDSPLSIDMIRAIMTSKDELPFKISALPPVLAADIARADDTAPAKRLDAIKRARALLSADDLRLIFQTAQSAEGALAGGAPNIDALLDAKQWTLPDWANAYQSLSDPARFETRAKTAAVILKRAAQAGLSQPVEALLANEITGIGYTEQAAANAELFAKLAIQRRDFSALRGLYDGLPQDDVFRGRIALASDALGGAFFNADLGTDIEGRLAMDGDVQNQAVRDTYIAVALGARLSVKASDIITDINVSKGKAANSGKLLALRRAAESGSKAETALRAAAIFSKTPPQDMRVDSLASIIFAFLQAGMTEQAAQLAAEDFLASALQTAQ